jgi:hypothetical protein
VQVGLDLKVHDGKLMKMWRKSAKEEREEHAKMVKHVPMVNPPVLSSSQTPVAESQGLVETSLPPPPQPKGGLLTATLKGRQLVSADGNGNASENWVCVMTVGKEVQRTKAPIISEMTTKARIRGIQFMRMAPKDDILHIRLFADSSDATTRDPLGHVEIPLASVMESGIIDKIYPMPDAANCSLDLRLEFAWVDLGF